MTQGGHGWLMTLADLTIILFMVTAADLSRADASVKETAKSVAAVATAEPVAIFRPGVQAGSLGAWLAGQPADPRQQLTVLVRHAGDEDAAALARGMALLGEASDLGRKARLIVEPGERSEVAAFLAYDAAPAQVARQLHEKNARNKSEEDQ